jgi:hypothetical protein
VKGPGGTAVLYPIFLGLSFLLAYPERSFEPGPGRLTEESQRDVGLPFLVAVYKLVGFIQANPQALIHVADQPGVDLSIDHSGGPDPYGQFLPAVFLPVRPKVARL